MQALWQPRPEQIQKTRLHQFIEQSTSGCGNYHELYNWSIENPELFWSEVWDFCGITGEKGARVLEKAKRFQDNRWFPQAKLNFAENCLKIRDDRDAIVFRGEDKLYKKMSYRELFYAVSSLANAFRHFGIKQGDIIAGVMPNMPETIIATLACAAVGAVWTSASPDFGVNGLVDRFSQSTPKLLITVDGYYYNGKSHPVTAKIDAMTQAVPSIEKVLVVNYLTKPSSTPDRPDKKQSFDQVLLEYATNQLSPEQLPFSHPLYVLYSSGTTGKPKCIVHSAGGTLIQHLKEHQLHCDIHVNDRVFFYTTCGWMMWNWLVSTLASGACIMLYDGSPFYPSDTSLLDYAEQEQCSFFGTSPKYLETLAKKGIQPIVTHPLSQLRTLASTGSVLAPETFDYVYHAIKRDINLASISGGTDIVSCFALGCSTEPVYRGQIQVRGLGMAVKVYNSEAQAIEQQRGELVCTQPFPSMPVAFLNDDEGQRYQNAYFDRFDNIWCHGDFIELTQQKGIIIYGRSDATLNPGGIRIGTAEIYQQIDTLEYVLQSVVVGLNDQSDVQVVLFVRLRDGETLSKERIQEIKQRIKTGCTARHVPAMVHQVSDIPTTLSGKISELAVRDVINGYESNQDRYTLANPESLDGFRTWRKDFVHANTSN